MGESMQPLISARGLTKYYGDMIGCRDVSFDLWPGEVMGIVGESGSGKSTLLSCLSGRLTPTGGSALYRSREFGTIDVHGAMEPIRRKLMRTEWGIVHQNPRDEIGRASCRERVLRLV